MSETRASTEDRLEPQLYQIRIQGHLAERWTAWFEGLTIVLTENGETLLTGPLIDQAALHGVLRKVRDLGMPLLSVNRVEPGPSLTLGTGPSLTLGTGPSATLGTGPSATLGTGQVDVPDAKHPDGDR